MSSNQCINYWFPSIIFRFLNIIKKKCRNTNLMACYRSRLKRNIRVSKVLSYICDQYTRERGNNLSESNLLHVTILQHTSLSYCLCSLSVHINLILWLEVKNFHLVIELVTIMIKLGIYISSPSIHWWLPVPKD